jgi:hypothetical protein
MTIQTIIDWIPIESRMPDKDDLVFLLSGDPEWPVWPGFYSTVTDEWCHADCSQVDWTVTHWAPIPNHPLEGKAS